LAAAVPIGGAGFSSLARERKRKLKRRVEPKEIPVK